MSDSEAIVKAKPSGQSLVAHGTEWEAIQAQARMLLKSGFFPKAVGTAEKAIAIMLAGRELGLAPMQSIRVISIVDGKPTLAAETMLALAYQRIPGLIVKVDTQPDRAIVTGCRPGSPPTQVTFSMKDAAAAGLTGKDNWRKYPAAMCRARAISAWCRVVAPDAILGCYTPEEVESIRPEPAGPIPAPAESADYWNKRRAAETPVIDITGAQEVAQEPEPHDPRPTQEEPAQDEPGANDGPPAEPVISDPQKKRLWALTMARAAALGVGKKEGEAALRDILGRHGYEHSNDVPRSAYEQVCKEAGEWNA